MDGTSCDEARIVVLSDGSKVVMFVAVRMTASYVGLVFFNYDVLGLKLCLGGCSGKQRKHAKKG